MSEKYRKNRGKSARLQEIRGSQNFITSRRLLERIVRKSTITKDDVVLEIGTGKGHLTEMLCRKAKYVISVEIDAGLYERAKERLSNRSNVTVLCRDFMTWPLPNRRNYKVFANIPFCITTKIVQKLTEDVHPPSEIWLVMEQGAAKRFLGVPRETKYSISLKRRWKLDIVYYFSREDFHPKPSVDSVLLHFVRKGK